MAAGPLAAEDVRFLLVHHTASSNRYAPEEVPSIIRGAFRFHTGPDKGWPDIAYNFLIDRYGGIWEGRTGSLAGPVVADATGGSQGFAQLVCLIGNFMDEAPTAASMDALVTLLAWLGRRHALDLSPGATTEFISRGSNLWPSGTAVVTPTIAGHRDMSATACPGDVLYPVVRQSLPQRVVDAGSTLSTSTTSSTVSAATTTSSTTTQAPSTTTSPNEVVASTTQGATTTTRPPASTSSPSATWPETVGPSEAASRPTQQVDSRRHGDSAPGAGPVVGVGLIGAAAVAIGAWWRRSSRSEGDVVSDRD